LHLGRNRRGGLGVDDGLLVLVGGVLLVKPGVVTDVVGLSLLLPRSRALLVRIVVAYIERAIRDGRILVTHVSFAQPGEPLHRRRPPHVIDVSPAD
jgi:UPF0716 family protein affecting phage T7 exclusion